MADIKDRAREYIAKHSEYSEVFGQTFVAVDTLTAMVEFAEQETKELEQKLETERNSRIALVNKIAELELQNEKLQNCWNCKKSFNRACSFGKKCEAKKKKCKEWEIKEND